LNRHLLDYALLTKSFVGVMSMIAGVQVRYERKLA